MEFSEYQIKQIFSETETTRPDGLVVVEVNMTTGCNGVMEDMNFVFSKDRWDEVKKKGSFRVLEEG